jgi:hypothetical protein
VTNGKAVDRLFFRWLAFALALLALVTVQAIMGKYGSDWGVPGQWVLALVAPAIALLGAASTNKGKGGWKNEPVDVAAYRLATGLSLIVWVGGIGVFVFEAVSSHYRIYDLLPIAGFALLVVQGFAIAAISSIVFTDR